MAPELTDETDPVEPGIGTYSIVEMLSFAAKPCDSHRGNCYPDRPGPFPWTCSHWEYHTNVENILFGPIARYIFSSGFAHLACKLTKKLGTDQKHQIVLRIKSIFLARKYVVIKNNDQVQRKSGKKKYKKKCSGKNGCQLRSRTRWNQDGKVELREWRDELKKTCICKKG